MARKNSPEITVISPGDDPDKVKGLQPQKDADIAGKKPLRISLRRTKKKKPPAEVAPSSQERDPNAKVMDMQPGIIKEQRPKNEARAPIIHKKEATDDLLVKESPTDPLIKATTTSKPIGLPKQPKKEEPKPKGHKGEKLTYSYSHNSSELHKLRRERLGLAMLVIAVVSIVGLAGYIFGPLLYEKLTANPKLVVESMLVKVGEVSSLDYEVNTSADFGLVKSNFLETGTTETDRRIGGTYAKAISSGDISVDISAELAADSIGSATFNLDAVTIKRGDTSLDIDPSGVTNKWFNLPVDTDLLDLGFLQGVIDIGVYSSSKSNYRQLIFASGLGSLSEDRASDIVDAYSLSSCEFTDISGKEAAKCNVSLDIAELSRATGIDSASFSPTHSDFTVFVDVETLLPIEVRYLGLKNQDTAVTFRSFNNEKRVSIPQGAFSYEDVAAEFAAFNQEIEE